MMHRLLLLLLVGTGGCAHYTAAPISAEKFADEWQARGLADPGLHAFIRVASPGLAQPWPRASWDLDGLTLVGFHYNPELAVARAEWETATAGIQAAGARPNPTVGISPGYNFNAEGGKSPWFPGFTIELPIETAGRRGIRLTRAERLALSARLRVTNAAWELRHLLRGALLDFTAAGRRLELLRGQRQVQERIIGLLAERRSLGAVGAMEVSTARIALAKLRVEASEAERQRNEAQNRLAAALGVPLSALAGLKLEFPLEPAPIGPDRTELRRLALQGRSDIRAALADYDVSEAGLRAEIAKQYPDLRLGTGYEWDQGENKWNLALSLELPVFDRNRGGIAEAEAKRHESAARFGALQAKIAAEIDRAVSAQALATEQFARVRDLNEALAAQIGRLRDRLATGDVDQLEYQTARLENAAGAVALLDSATRVAQAAGELEDALQIPFPALAFVGKPNAAPEENHLP